MFPLGNTKSLPGRKPLRDLVRTERRDRLPSRRPILLRPRPHQQRSSWMVWFIIAPILALGLYLSWQKVLDQDEMSRRRLAARRQRMQSGGAPSFRPDDA